MMNMGGPEHPKDVGTFLDNLFGDRMIIDLGKFQKLGLWAAKKRTPKIEKQYAAIGGSPIRKWTNAQGEQMAKLLDTMSPETAPHKHYAMFRYAAPYTEDVLKQMKEDGVERAVAFSQYPMYSCTTTGSSITHLWESLEKEGVRGDFKWSVIDRWNDQPTYIKAIANRIKMGLQQFPEDIRGDVMLMFSAHSLPMKVVAKGDQYSQEVGHTTQLVMKELGYSHQYMLAWQSKVGFLPWLVPSTEQSIIKLAKQGKKEILVVPIAFTSDHIETLYEIDIEYKKVASEHGVTHFYSAPSLNDEPLLAQAQAEIVAKHLKKCVNYDTKQYEVKCLDCINPLCRTVQDPAH